MSLNAAIAFLSNEQIVNPGPKSSKGKSLSGLQTPSFDSYFTQALNPNSNNTIEAKTSTEIQTSKTPKTTQLGSSIKHITPEKTKDTVDAAKRFNSKSESLSIVEIPRECLTIDENGKYQLNIAALSSDLKEKLGIGDQDSVEIQVVNLSDEPYNHEVDQTKTTEEYSERNDTEQNLFAQQQLFFAQFSPNSTTKSEQQQETQYTQPATEFFDSKQSNKTSNLLSALRMEQPSRVERIESHSDLLIEKTETTSNQTIQLTDYYVKNLIPSPKDPEKKIVKKEDTQEPQDSHRQNQSAKMDSTNLDSSENSELALVDQISPMQISPMQDGQPVRQHIESLSNPNLSGEKNSLDIHKQSLNHKRIHSSESSQKNEPVHLGENIPKANLSVKDTIVLESEPRVQTARSRQLEETQSVRPIQNVEQSTLRESVPTLKIDSTSESQPNDKPARLGETFPKPNLSVKDTIVLESEPHVQTARSRQLEETQSVRPIQNVEQSTLRESVPTLKIDSTSESQPNDEPARLGETLPKPNLSVKDTIVLESEPRVQTARSRQLEETQSVRPIQNVEQSTLRESVPTLKIDSTSESQPNDEPARLGETFPKNNLSVKDTIVLEFEPRMQTVHSRQTVETPSVRLVQNEEQPINDKSKAQPIPSEIREILENHESINAIHSTTPNHQSILEENNTERHTAPQESSISSFSESAKNEKSVFQSPHALTQSSIDPEAEPIISPEARTVIDNSNRSEKTDRENPIKTLYLIQPDHNSDEEEAQIPKGVLLARSLSDGQESKNNSSVHIQAKDSMSKEGSQGDSSQKNPCHQENSDSQNDSSRQSEAVGRNRLDRSNEKQETLPRFETTHKNTQSSIGRDYQTVESRKPEQTPIQQQLQNNCEATLLEATNHSRLVQSVQPQDPSDAGISQTQQSIQSAQPVSMNVTSAESTLSGSNIEHYAEKVAEIQDAAAKQIVRGVQGLIGTERSHITLRLTPETLGRIHIQMTLENGTLTTQITAQKESTRTLLDQSVNNLRASFENQGIKVDRLVINKDTLDFRQPDQGRNEDSQERSSKNRSSFDQRSGTQGQNMQDQNHRGNSSKPRFSTWSDRINAMDYFM